MYVAWIIFNIALFATDLKVEDYVLSREVMMV